MHAGSPLLNLHLTKIQHLDESKLNTPRYAVSVGAGAR
jgi:hypothetical protein